MNPKSTNGPGWRWALLMSWRDSRRNRFKLLLFVLSIVFGLSALIAIRGFRSNVERAIDEQSKELLGADVEFHSRSEYPEEVETFIDQLQGRRANEVRLATMALFESNGGSRLVQLRAFEEAFPFYGIPETRPENLMDRFHNGRYVLMEESLVHQYSVALGDRVKLGNLYFEVLGIVDRIPGESNLTGWVAPRVYLSKSNLEDTGLLQFGSRVSYRAYVKLEDPTNVESELASNRGFFRANRIGYDTVEEEREELIESFQRVTDLLTLIGFMALILGGVGVTSAVHVYLSGKMDTMAILRCLGTRSSQVVAIFLFQITGLGLVAALIGSLIGSAIQFFITLFIQDFLPFVLKPRFSWWDLGIGLLFGWVVCFLFTLLPLLPLRKISPLRVLRTEVEKPGTMKRDPWVYAIVAILGLTLFGFGFAQTDNLKINLAFSVGLVAVLGLLALIAWLFLKWIKKPKPSRLPFEWRYGIANLYRPNNRTVLMLVALGVGFVMVLCLFLTKEAILKQLNIDRGENAPNMIFFDIQPSQLDGSLEIIERNQMPILESAPIVSMRISEVNGTPVRSLFRRGPRGNNDGPEGWTLRREYRSTFRGHLTDGEVLAAGRFIPQASMEDEPIPISISQGLLEDMGLNLGDRLRFNVQGLPLETEIASVRIVDWNQMRPNFFFVFPQGVLEEAPRMYIVATRTPDPRATAQVQSDLIKKYPNISSIDLRLILTTIDDILTKVSWMVQFMALFTISAGLLVMAGAIITSRYQRIRESVLLRTLGANSQTIRRILFIEFASIGLLASIIGGMVSVVATWALMKFLIQLPLIVAWDVVLAGMLAMTVLTTLTGLLNSRGITRQAPLEILRQE